MAAAMGIEMLTEAQYRELQTLGEFDTKTNFIEGQGMTRVESLAGLELAAGADRW